jgi:dTMP kinase
LLGFSSFSYVMVRFVTFEGGDGTGKTTQIRALANYLTSKGKACLVTREPGGTELGAMLRRVLLEAGGAPIAPSSELFLYLADRAQHVSEVIRPAVAAGRIVLCDRFTDSTLAYQGYGALRFGFAAPV